MDLRHIDLWEERGGPVDLETEKSEETYGPQTYMGRVLYIGQVLNVTQHLCFLSTMMTLLVENEVLSI